MAVALADSFLDAVDRLDSAGRAGAYDFVSKLRRNQATVGLSLERVKRAQSKDMWSGRIGQGLRAILHQDNELWTLLYADRHDDAYHWAERFEVGRHPVTGTLQVVEVVTRVEERLEIREVLSEASLFDRHQDEYLLSLGVPESWLPTLRKVGREDQLEGLLPQLPPDVADRLYLLACGELVAPPVPLRPDQPATASPDTLRRFYVVDSDDDLQAVLNAPMHKWLAFLHPTQRNLATGSFKGPVKVTGSAGTGKTVVLLHRARHLARQGKRVLLTTFVNTLADNLRRNLAMLCAPEELALITTSTVHAEALALVRRVEPQAKPLQDSDVRRMLEETGQHLASPFDGAFLAAEWEKVLSPQGILTWAQYRSASRTGRGRPLSVADRKEAWKVFEQVRGRLVAERADDFPGLCRQALELLQSGRVSGTYEAVLVDEVQDLKPQELRLLAALCGQGPDRLMLAGDAGQRIYAGGFSLRALGIETRGRSHILKINYRTTEQIRTFADRILGEVAHDLEGGTESRKGTRSLLRGPVPQVHSFATPQEEVAFVVERIQKGLAEGLQPQEIAIFARVANYLERFEGGLTDAGLPVHQVKSNDPAPAGVQLGTMHRAKGLEFKVVFVVGCSEDQIPSPRALRAAGDDPADRDEALANERRLLYVSLTRARDEVVVSLVGKGSGLLGARA